MQQFDALLYTFHRLCMGKIYTIYFYREQIKRFVSHKKFVRHWKYFIAILIIIIIITNFHSVWKYVKGNFYVLKTSSTSFCKFFMLKGQRCVLNWCIWDPLNEKSEFFFQSFNKVIRQKAEATFKQLMWRDRKSSVGALKMRVSKKKCIFYYTFMLARNVIKLSETTCCICTYRRHFIAWPILSYLLTWMNPLWMRIVTTLYLWIFMSEYL